MTIIRIKVENFLVLYTICYLTIYSVEKAKRTENKSHHFIRSVYFSLSKNSFYGEANLMLLQKCAQNWYVGFNSYKVNDTVKNAFGSRNRKLSSVYLTNRILIWKCFVSGWGVPELCFMKRGMSVLDILSDVWGICSTFRRWGRMEWWCSLHPAFFPS